MCLAFYFVGKDMRNKQKNNWPEEEYQCNIDDHIIFTYDSFPETFLTLFRASMGGYDVSFPLPILEMQVLLQIPYRN